MTVRTRIAPSPTGYPHIGTIYQALLDKGFAKKRGGKFIMRIEDTDQKRFVGDAESKIYESLDWAGLGEDESVRKGGDYGPYIQSERLGLYQKYAKELIDKGHAYYCFCSSERLQELREEQQKNKKPPMYDKHCRKLSKEDVARRIEAGEKYVVRMKVPENEKIVVNDLVRGDIEFESSTVDDQVIVKSDGFPTYHLAVVIDDHLMKISHVVRGPEWIPSFPKHKLLYDFFGWDMPVFVHTPLITNMSGKKLSKRDESTNVDWYRKEGFLPEALVNFISLLGWSHPEEKEIFSFEEFSKHFELKDLSPVNPKLDLVKLEWMNGQYIKKLSPEEFSERALENNSNLKKYDQELLSRVLPLVQERVRKLSEVEGLIKYFFEDPLNTEEVKKLSIKESKADYATTKERIAKTIDVLNGINPWSAKEIDEVLHQLMEKEGIKPRQFFMPIRIIVTGIAFSPPIGDTLEVLGKESTLRRLRGF